MLKREHSVLGAFIVNDRIVEFSIEYINTLYPENTYNPKYEQIDDKILSLFLKKITVYWVSRYICTVMAQLVLLIRFIENSINALHMLEKILAIHFVLLDNTTLKPIFLASLLFSSRKSKLLVQMKLKFLHLWSILKMLPLYYSVYMCIFINGLSIF